MSARPTKIDPAEARRLKATGMSSIDIAERFGVKASTVSTALKRDVEIPAWVPEHLHSFYRMTALDDGEEAAASLCRKLKRETRDA